MSSERIFSRLYDSITKGDMKESFEIFIEYSKKMEKEDFNEILNSVVIKINEDYENKKISKATFHVAQIISETLEKMISGN